MPSLKDRLSGAWPSASESRTHTWFRGAPTLSLKLPEGKTANLPLDPVSDTKEVTTNV